MSFGEVALTRSTAGRPGGSGITWAMRSGSRTRSREVGRFLTPLLLLCCLSVALCGVASGAEEDYAPLWGVGVNDAVRSVAITQDGSRIVAGAGSGIYLLDRQGNVLWKILVGSRVNGVGISPEGSYIGVAADKLYLYDGNGSLLWTEKTTFIYRSVALSSNGTYIAAGCDNGAVYIFDLDKKQLWDYDMGTDGYGIAISENGRKIAVGCDDQGVYYLNSREGESWSYGTGNLVKSVALTPDARFVAAGSYDRCVYLSTGEGEHLWKYPTKDAIIAVALTNEADEIFAASGRTVYVLDWTGAELQKIALSGRAESLAVTPDGSFLVVGGGDGDRFIRLFTDDASLLEGREPVEVAANETGPQNQTASDTPARLPPPDNGTATAGVNASARDEGAPLTSQVAGWLENIVALLFKPQEDFLA